MFRPSGTAVFRKLKKLHGEVRASREAAERASGQDDGRPATWRDGACGSPAGDVERLFDVQRPLLSVGTAAAVVEDPVRRVRALLDLGDQYPGADGVDRSGLHEEHVSRLHGRFVQHLRHRAVRYPPRQLLPGNIPFKAAVEKRPGFPVEYVPHLRLPRAPPCASHTHRPDAPYRKRFPGVDQLDQHGSPAARPLPRDSGTSAETPTAGFREGAVAMRQSPSGCAASSQLSARGGYVGPLVEPRLKFRPPQR